MELEFVLSCSIKVTVRMLVESQNSDRTWTFLHRSDKLKVISKFNCPWRSPLLMKLHGPHASRRARLPATPSTCNLISRVFPCRSCRCSPSELNCWRDTKKSFFHYPPPISEFPTRAPGSPPPRGGLIQSHGGVLQCGSQHLIGSLVSPSSVMVMSCVVCLFRLKVISFVAFSSLPSAFAP